MSDMESTNEKNRENIAPQLLDHAQRLDGECLPATLERRSGALRVDLAPVGAQ